MSQDEKLEIFANLIKANIHDYEKKAETKFSHDFKKLWENKKYGEANIALFKNLKDKYGKEELNRKMIINLFKNEETYYDGFLCAMIWGKIGSYNVEWFKKAFEQENEQKVRDVVDLLKKGEIKKAYNYLSNGDGKINGVNEAFFTKLLYFAGAAICEDNQCHLPFQPLIFDSVMKGVYVRLSKFIIGSQMPGNSYERYEDYCRMMERLKELLGLETTGHVEALFFRP